ncbi:MAG TPA: DUF721 domain-containing protein [Candidatus Binatia bacterium]
MIPKLRELLSDVLRGAGLEPSSDLWQIAETWSATLGARIARHATPVRLARGELVVAVGDAVWRQELALLTADIAARLNQALGRDVVQRIRLVGGEVTLDAALAARERDRERRRLPSDASAIADGARSARTPAATPTHEPKGELAAALRSLAAKRTERLVADGALRRRARSHT